MSAKENDASLCTTCSPPPTTHHSAAHPPPNQQITPHRLLPHTNTSLRSTSSPLPTNHSALPDPPNQHITVRQLLPSKISPLLLAVPQTICIKIRQSSQIVPCPPLEQQNFLLFYPLHFREITFSSCETYLSGKSDKSKQIIIMLPSASPTAANKNYGQPNTKLSSLLTSTSQAVRNRRCVSPSYTQNKLSLGCLLLETESTTKRGSTCA